MSDSIIVKKNGKTFEIPGIWVAGTVEQARRDGYQVTAQSVIEWYIQTEIDSAS